MAGFDKYASLQLPLRTAPPRVLPERLIEVSQRAFATKYLESIGVSTSDKNIEMILYKLQVNKSSLNYAHVGEKGGKQVTLVTVRRIAVLRL
jgi:hypothetical protein